VFLHSIRVPARWVPHRTLLLHWYRCCGSTRVAVGYSNVTARYRAFLGSWFISSVGITSPLYITSHCLLVLLFILYLLFVSSPTPLPATTHTFVATFCALGVVFPLFDCTFVCIYTLRCLSPSFIEPQLVLPHIVRTTLTHRSFSA